MATEFPLRARRNDPNGHMTVQEMLYFLRDEFDRLAATIQRGSTLVLNGSTFIDVSLDESLATYSVVVTPTTAPGGYFWVSNKSSTSFRINLAVAAPIAGVAFDWIVKGA